MSKISLLEGLLLNLKGEIDERRREFLPKSEAYRQLKSRTGQDFGYDASAWEEWIRKNALSTEATQDVSPRVAKFLAFGGVKKSTEEPS